MNAPDREDNVRNYQEEVKVGFKKDIKVTNAANFILWKEDHTLGNMLRMKLLEDPEVIFAGYRHPHPLETFVEFKVRTNGNVEPVQALKLGTNQLMTEVTLLENRMKEAVELKTRENSQYDDF